MASTDAPTGQDPAPRSLRWRRLIFAISALAFVPLFALTQSFLKLTPLWRCLLGTGVFAAAAVGALWFLGREKHPMLRAARLAFVVWGLLLLPLIFTVADGLAAQGWPSGRMNKSIANLMILVLNVTIPALLMAILALTRMYRLAGALALLTGLLYLVNSVFLFRATAPAKGLRLQFESVLDLFLLGAQLVSYVAIPVGVALLVGGSLTFRAARLRGGR